LETNQINEQNLEEKQKEWYGYQYLKGSARRHFFAVLDRYPRTEGDTLIISRKNNPHYTDIADPLLVELKPEAREDFFDFLTEIVSALRKMTEDEKHPKVYMMSMCEHWEPKEIKCNHSTEHLHIHLLPRHKKMRIEYPYFVPEHMFIRCQDQTCKLEELLPTKQKLMENLKSQRDNILNEIYKKMQPRSGKVLSKYVSEFTLNVDAHLRFFSYGSNMNEEKFRVDTRRGGYEFGLFNPKKRVLPQYERVLGNESIKYGLAFTICPCESEHMEGICHDVPIGGLDSFLQKEGLFLDKPSYELIVVSVSDEEHPVLTLKGLKPSSYEKLDCRSKLSALLYLDISIMGAERWNVEHSDMLKMKELIEEALCG
jgi:diadenosine tetraphosphate (Ap4A) HIT family hydrolase